MKTCIKSFALMVAAVFGLAACGGGGGSSTGANVVPDTMTLTVSGPTWTTVTAYTEGAYNTLGYLDPSMASMVTPSGNTYVSLCSGATGTMCATTVSVSIRGSAVQSYPTGTSGSPTQVTYKVNDKVYSSVSPSASGMITLTGVGAVGEKITGTFDAIVVSGTDTRGISGTFSVTRDY